MQITEKDLEDLMFDDLINGGDRLRSRGFTTDLTTYNLPNKVYWKRQLNLKQYGIADIVGFTRMPGGISVELIELKNVPLKSEDFNQVLRYAAGIESIIRWRFKGIKVFISSYLVGPSIETGHFIHNSSRVELVTFDFKVDGFEFRHHTKGWTIGDRGSIKLTDLKLCEFVPMTQQIENGEEIHRHQ
jgi:hypothetical protein